MAKPEWGIKRVCQSCGARFYDLRRHPIVCPKCATVYDAESATRTRRSRTPAVAGKPAHGTGIVRDVAEAPRVPVESDVVGDDAEPAEQEREEEEILEDASELGEDEDDMAEVIENVEGDEEP